MAEGEFTPCCWRYTTLKDLVEDMLEEEREANPWTCKDGNIIMSMIIMSKKGVDLCIRTLINTPPPPHQLLEAGGSQCSDTDSLSSGGSDLTITGKIPRAQREAVTPTTWTEGRSRMGNSTGWWRWTRIRTTTNWSRFIIR